VEEQNGRMVKIKGRWYCDFASANYLGLDLHPQVMASIAPMIEQWGVHPSWTRAVASPEIYRTLERRLASFVGAPDTLIFPTITLLHMGVLPLLATPSGVILLDQKAHNSMWEAAKLASASGTAVDSFAHNDLEDLQDKLIRHQERGPKIIAIDGVYSMSGSYPPLPELIEIAHRHKARLYIDDAHGFGVVGENPTRENPHGKHGNGIVRYFGRRYAEDNIVYVAGMSKAFSSMIAFVTCANDAERCYLANASTLIFGGPTPTASLASALTGLEVNEKEGTALRNQLLDLSWQLVRGARALGLEVKNNELFPLVSVVVGDIPNTIKACQILWDQGILITPALFPVVPLDQGLLRFTLTAANTQEQVSQALEALNAVRSSPYRTHTSEGVYHSVGCDFAFDYT
jgi:7-keto-8-aminopelargonate synthetase-like enzyme